MSFPKNFYWGGATAANQFEGGYNKGGKGKTKTDFSTAGTATQPRYVTYKLKDGSVGKSTLLEPLPLGAEVCGFAGLYYPNQIAVDFYHRYKEDIKLLAELGIKMFRMSISWSRIYPNGIENEPNQEGLDFYRDVFTELKKYGIEPLVTMLHSDTPSYLEEELGGWSDRRLIDCYVKYTSTILNEYKGLVKYWLTFNEINVEMMFFMLMDKKYLTPEFCTETLTKLHNQFVASALTVKNAHAIDSNYRVGCMVAGACAYPLTPDPKDILNNQQYSQQYIHYSGDVMVRGKYPSFAKKIWDNYGVHFDITDEDLEILRNGTVDFYSFSYYATLCTTTHEGVEMGGKGNLALGVINPYLEYNEWGWPIDGYGLRYYLNELYDRYQIPLMVVENGIGNDDKLEDDKTIHDPYRISYMRENIEAMKGAFEDGVELIAYTPWGIIDLIAASTGEMKKRYGVIYVDLDDKGNGTLNRYPKDSFYWYKKAIASNGESLD